MLTYSSMNGKCLGDMSPHKVIISNKSISMMIEYLKHLDNAGLLYRTLTWRPEHLPGWSSRVASVSRGRHRCKPFALRVEV